MSENYKLKPGEIINSLDLDSDREYIADGTTITTIDVIPLLQAQIAKVKANLKKDGIANYNNTNPRLQAITDAQLKRDILEVLIWVGVDRTVDIAYAQIIDLLSAKIQEAETQLKLADKNYLDLKNEFDNRIEGTRQDERWKVGEELCCLIGNTMLRDIEAGKLLGSQLNEYMKQYLKGKAIDHKED